MYIAGALIWILATRYLGDWRHWEKYHHTILYFILCDLLYNFLTSDFPLWEYDESLLLPSHTATNLVIMFIIYPCTVLIFLPYTTKLHKPLSKFMYISSWVVLYAFFEWLFEKIGVFHYHNGWSLLSSIIFDYVMFSMLYLHFKRPLIAYILSVPITVILLLFFNVPVTEWR